MVAANKVDHARRTRLALLPRLLRVQRAGEGRLGRYGRRGSIEHERPPARTQSYVGNSMPEPDIRACQPSFPDVVQQRRHQQIFVVC